MSVRKRYFYMRLKDDFFNEPTIRYLMSLENGYELTILYMQMLLISIKTDGQLQLIKDKPIDAKILSAVTLHTEEIVTKGLEEFRQLELITEVNEKTFMTNIQALIGTSSSEGDRVKAYRQKINSLDDSLNNDTETVKTSHKRKSREKKKFNKPTPEEIQEYAQSINFHLDPFEFWDYYEQRDWSTGKNNQIMKDWKIAVRTWQRNQKKSKGENNNDVYGNANTDAEPNEHHTKYKTANRF